MKAGIATEAEVHSLSNDSLARVPAATNINKYISVTMGEWQLTVRCGGRYSVLPEVIKESSFVNSLAGIVGSNPTQGMDVCIEYIYSVCVVLCVGRGLAKGWSPVQGFLPTVYRIKKLKSGHGPTKGCTANNNNNNNLDWSGPNIGTNVKQKLEAGTSVNQFDKFAVKMKEANATRT
jgi:hypothetical protein